jgi:Glycosyltransferase like family
LIAFGSSISGAEAFRRYAEPGIRLAAEPDSELLAYATVEPVARTYNLIMDAAAALAELEALVLVQPHTEIVDPGFCAKVREGLADPDMGAIGCAGARNVHSIAWWEGEVVCGAVRQRYEENHGGEIPSFSWAEHSPPPAEVDALDGQLLILSPWTVRNVRFDETLLLNHGFDLDFSLQVRQAGRKLRVLDLAVVHHRSLELISDLAVWVEAHIRIAEKWNGTLHPALEDEAAWKRRARRAEARREAARAIAMSESLKLDARVLELEREFEAQTSSTSWHLTAPLRALNKLRREAVERRNGSGRERGDGSGRERGNGSG